MGKCTFSNIWLDKVDEEGNKISEWGKQQDNGLYCIVCNYLIPADKGFYSIKRHYGKDKHKNNFNQKKGSSQLYLSLKETLDSSASESNSNASGSNKVASLHLYSSKEDSLAAELIWCMKIVACNMSIESSNGIADVFKAMFPGTVPDKFSLNPTKAGYLITDALAPYFRELFLSEVQDIFFPYNMMKQLIMLDIKNFKF